MNEPHNDNEPSARDYDMVMPFLPVHSKGGPYNDDAYVSGYEAGLIDAACNTSAVNHAVPLARSIHRANAAQVDLIAMRYGYTATFTPYDETWVTVTFS